LIKSESWITPKNIIKKHITLKERFINVTGSMFVHNLARIFSFAENRIISHLDHVDEY